MRMLIPSFLVQRIIEGFWRTLKKCRFLQSIYIIKNSKYVRDSQGITEFIDEQYLKYFSNQIFWVDEVINTALLKESYSLRKLNQWVKEARVLEREANDLIKQHQYSTNPSLKSEELLKHVYQKIFQHLQNCPFKDIYDKPILFLASMHGLEDKASSSYAELETEHKLKPLQREDVLQDVGKSVAAEVVSVTAGNDREAVSSPDSCSAYISELSNEHMPMQGSMWGGETEEGGPSNQVHDSMIIERSSKVTNLPYISGIEIEDRHKSEITAEGTDSDGMEAEISSLPIQQETELHRKHEKMPITSMSINPNEESGFCSEAEVEPEISPELPIERTSDADAQESNRLGESSATPNQSDVVFHENEAHDFEMIDTISVTGAMSDQSVDRNLEILSSSSSQETHNLNNYFGLNPERDGYLFSAMKKLTKLELDKDRTSTRGQQSLGPPETSQLTGGLLQEYLIVNQSDFRSKEMPTAEEWREARVANLVGEKTLLLPEEPDYPNPVLFFIQENKHFTYIPPSFFNHMPALSFLDLSNTRIRALPSSLFALTKLKVLILRNCVCLSSLPSEIGNLRSMEDLDLSGTEVYDLPDEIGQLKQLKHLQLSFYAPDDGRGYAHLPSVLVSRDIIFELQFLQELSITVHPEDQRWIEIAGDVIRDVGRLKMLSYLQFYFPTIEVLESFIEMSPSWKEQRMRKFRFVVGHDIKRIISRVPDEVGPEYDRYDQCLRFVNGNEVPQVLKTVLKLVTAFYLDHHSEIQSLSEFGISNFQELRFCLVRECPNIQVITIEEKRSTESVFPNLEQLRLHYLWELEKICEDPVPPGSFQVLRYLTVDTCPKLEYILSQSMLQCLSNLERLSVEDCESVKAIVKENEKAKLHDDDALLPRLTELVLSHLPQLVTLGCGLCPSRDKINVHCCPKFGRNTQPGRVKRRKLLGNCSTCI